MTPKQITQVAILYQLLLYKRFKVAKDAPLVHKLAGANDSHELNEYDKHHLSKVWADNRKEIEKLERTWML